MKINYRPFLLGFSIVYAGLAVGSLLIAISLAQSAAPTCATGQCPSDRECCLSR
ncbi:hypothetical protein [Pseudomonas sp.]|uniref:hypothetical protein n=1 Tax=Pseudomonas sp. TaxID=306 RepID=UPI002CDD1ABF|nr:hypothetical protein [Pseudomonas sp.]HUE94289.1 hypothetical protein [Pseudomonas sp.]